MLAQELAWGWQPVDCVEQGLADAELEQIAGTA